MADQLPLFSPPPRKEQRQDTSSALAGGCDLPPCTWCGGERGGFHIWSHSFGRIHEKCIDEATEAVREIDPRPERWKGIVESL